MWKQDLAVVGAGLALLVGVCLIGMEMDMQSSTGGEMQVELPDLAEIEPSDEVLAAITDVMESSPIEEPEPEIADTEIVGPEFPESSQAEPMVDEEPSVRYANGDVKFIRQGLPTTFDENTYDWCDHWRNKNGTVPEGYPQYRNGYKITSVTLLQPPACCR